MIRLFVGLAMFAAVAVGLYAQQGEAMAGCLKGHSYDTCATTLNR